MEPTFTELDEANRKVRNWKREAKQSAPVHLSSGVDLTVSPSDAQDVLPRLSPFEVIRTGDILGRLVQVPSITSTAAVSAAFGGIVTFIFTFHRHPKTDGGKLDFLRRSMSNVLRLILWVVTSLSYLHFLRRRYPLVQRVSQYQNLSSSSEGPCFVANNVLTITSSQAGTHADGPHHFCRSLSHRNYDDAHYSGDAVVLDVSAALRHAAAANEPRAITVELMEKACAQLPDAYRNGACPLWRILIVTRRFDEANSSSGSNNGPSFVMQSLNLLLDVDGNSTNNATSTMRHAQSARSTTLASTSAPGNAAAADSARRGNLYAFLYPETVEYLHRVFPHLLLVGIDTPSVDEVGVAPLMNHSHGALLRCGMAILENLRFNRLYPLLETGVDGHRGVVIGSMLTVFSATQNFDDARGCSVVFFPEQAEL